MENKWEINGLIFFSERVKAERKNVVNIAMKSTYLCAFSTTKRQNKLAYTKWSSSRDNFCKGYNNCRKYHLTGAFGALYNSHSSKFIKPN